jgi:hypothetical protein
MAGEIFNAAILSSSLILISQNSRTRGRIIAAGVWDLRLAPIRSPPPPSFVNFC